MNNKQTIRESKDVEVFDEYLGKEKVEELKAAYSAFWDKLSKKQRFELDRLLT